MTREEGQQELEQQEQQVDAELNALCYIQTELQAPKGQYNNFGKYSYRSCEDILKALKPLLRQTKTALIIEDDIKQVGERIYVHAVVSLYQGQKMIGSSSAFAREPISKKGMDDSQITGTASSYARKYALNGLFAIDDTKDADTDEHEQTKRNAPAVQAKEPRVPHVEQLVKQKDAMDGSGNLEMLKILAGSAYDYWDAWEMPDNKQVIRDHFDKLAKTFEKAA
jgi:hypothetical protein